jgi:hypothetical protein
MAGAIRECKTLIAQLIVAVTKISLSLAQVFEKKTIRAKLGVEKRSKVK